MAFFTLLSKKISDKLFTQTFIFVIIIIGYSVEMYICVYFYYVNSRCM